MTTTTREISAQNLHDRLALRGPPDELKELGDTIDGLLARLEAAFDAERRFGLAQSATETASECISGLVLQGRKRPYECLAFGTRCTPERPLGAPMVSSEGACAAYYRYRRLQSPAAAALPERG